MSYNGSGTFLINTAGQPVVSGTVISSTAFNALTADLATGLSTAITKDGQTTITANIPMANYKFTGLGTGSAAGDSANLSQVQSTAVKLLASVSGADTITAVGSPNVAAYVAGQMFYFVAAGANTGAVTINIDSLGAKNITRDGTTALAAGDIQSGEVCVIVYDGTQFQLVNGASQSASIVTENLTVNKATVLNESGGDNDTRIEGDTDANLFFVDASTDRIGVGTNAPSNKLTVSGNADITGNVGIGTASPASRLDVRNTGGTYDKGISIQTASAGNIGTFWTSSNDLNIGIAGAHNFTNFDGSATRMTLDANGVLLRGNTTARSTNAFGTGEMQVESAGYSAFQMFANVNNADGSYLGLWKSRGGTVGGTTIVQNGDLCGAVYFGGYDGTNAIPLAAVEGVVDGTPGANDMPGRIVFKTTSDGQSSMTERARITSGGTLLVNCTTAAANALFEVSSNGTKKSLQVYDNDNVQLYSLGTGTVYSNGGVLTNVNPSDERLKDDIADLSYGLEQVLALRPVSYKWKNDRVNQGTQYGFIAQEVQSTMPELVREFDAVEDDEPVKRYGLEKDGIYAALVKAIQEQQAMIEDLKAKVAALEAK